MDFAKMLNLTPAQFVFAMQITMGTIRILGVGPYVVYHPFYDPFLETKSQSFFWSFFQG